MNSYFSTFLCTGVLSTMMIKKKRITAALMALGLGAVTMFSQFPVSAAEETAQNTDAAAQTADPSVVVTNGIDGWPQASDISSAAAEAEADQIIQDAEAQKQVRINEAEAEVARFNAMYEEYVKNPEITKKRMFYEAMEDVLPGMKIVIDNGDGVQKVLPLDSFTGNSSENPTETLNTDTAQDTQDLNDSENE